MNCSNNLLLWCEETEACSILLGGVEDGDDGGPTHRLQKPTLSSSSEGKRVTKVIDRQWTEKKTQSSKGEQQVIEIATAYL